MTLKITVQGGKYEFRTIDGDYRIACLRYGEPWLEFEQGHKAILALMSEIEDLRERKADMATRELTQEAEKLGLYGHNLSRADLLKIKEALYIGQPPGGPIATEARAIVRKALGEE